MEAKGSFQTNWGLLVAIDHFFSGTGAGLYFIAAMIDLSLGREGVEASKIGVALGVPLVFLGLITLLLDLGVKTRAFRAYVKPERSWISRGTIIITCFLILGALHFGGWIWPFNFLEANGLRFTFEAVTSFFALCLMIYKGFLLGDVKPIPTWSTPILPFLYLISPLTIGTMLIWLATFSFSQTTLLMSLAKYIVILLVVKSLTLIFYLSILRQTITAKLSTLTIVRKELSVAFWVGVVLFGVVAPLSAGVVATLVPTTTFFPAIGFSLGVFGGFMLRYIVIFSGMKFPLEALGMTFVSFKPPQTE